MAIKTTLGKRVVFALRVDSESVSGFFTDRQSRVRRHWPCRTWQTRVVRPILA